MPLTDEQKTALATLTEADPNEVADALQNEAQGHYQVVYQRGFSTAHNEAKTKLETKEKEVAAAQEKVEQKETELQQLREKTPEVEEVRQDYEQKLQDKEAEKNAAIEAAQEKVEDLHRSRFEAELAGALIGAEVEPDYAREVLVPKHRGRIKVEEDGAVKFYDEDGATPLAAADGELANVAATKIKAGVDPKWIVSNADKGGGSDGQGGTGGSGKWDKIRKSAKDRHTQPDAEATETRRKSLLPQA